MKSIRHLPLAVFLLMLIAAIAAMSIGWVLAKEEREEVVVREDVPLTDFASALKNEIEGLEKNLDQALLELARSLEGEMSDRSRISLAKTYSGVRQIAVVKTGQLGKEFLLEQALDLEEPFPVPKIEGRGGIDLKRLKMPGLTYFWSKGRGRNAYFVTRPNWKSSRIFILGIDREEIVITMSSWLRKWAGKASEPLVVGEWNHRLLTPTGEELSIFKERANRPDTIYPVTSKMGTWPLQSWHQRRVVVEFREPVLITAGAIAVALVVLGVVLFFLLRRSLIVAMQRVSFVNQVSHELRTPLTNVMLNLDLAKDAVLAEGMATQRLGLMGEELGRLQRLLDNILTFSGRKEKQVLRSLQKLDLNSEVRQALDTMTPALMRQEISPEFEIEVGLRVLADPDALAQILGNLFSNVLKYGGDGSQLLVRGFSANGKVKVQVVDSGPGVVRKNRERIFRPFFRVSRRIDEGVSGSGLGLAISRDLVASMGGRLTCESREDGKSGACFELTLENVESETAIVPFESQAS